MVTPIGLTTVELMLTPLVMVALVFIAVYAPFWIVDVIAQLLRPARRHDALPRARVVARNTRT